MEKFNFTTLEMNEFASAFTFITEGKECLATEILKNLYCESHNLSLRSSCAKILFKLYFMKSEWKQLEILGLLDEQSIDQSNRLIAKACSKSKNRY
ncbi:hypothetical protein LAV73_13995 [Lysinibacillus xylanilyticus]|uniref:hypothetical protein n=1 Tax=Lysinibacillus xylanilyticus TaxID=582475 RepID=UPI002B24BC8E|nr:hypothetical protein [Lysinibacillus xylanilyticus]MEB2281096.1 hypothetical protein [Lysinibacillus xylanilyticus]